MSEALFSTGSRASDIAVAHHQRADQCPPERLVRFAGIRNPYLRTPDDIGRAGPMCFAVQMWKLFSGLPFLSVVEEQRRTCGACQNKGALLLLGLLVF